MFPFLVAVVAASPLLLAGEPYEPKAVSVVDGDTLKVDGVNVRVSNLDTPERGGRAECDAERFLAVVASKRAEALVAEGDLVIIPEGRTDRSKRPLVRVTVGGVDWASIMIAESLAVSWAGRQHDWCATQ
jgi:endonuclease YncB( thermonuclease family)